MFKLDELMLKVTEENKHPLILGSKDESPPVGPYENLNFTIQIHVEPFEESKARWARQMQSIKKGEFPTVTKHLSFETWEDFLSILSDKGKAIIEDMSRD